MQVSFDYTQKEEFKNLNENEELQVYHIKDEENAVVIKEEAGSVLKIILAIIAACLVYIIYMIIFGHVLFANHPVY